MHYDEFVDLWKSIESSPTERREVVECIDLDGMKRFGICFGEISRLHSEPVRFNQTKTTAYMSTFTPATDEDIEWLKDGLECGTVVLVSRKISGTWGVREFPDAGRVTKLHYGHLPPNVSLTGS